MVIWGSIAKIQIVWDIADLFMGIMALINLIVIAKLSNTAFAALKNYSKQKKEGKDPVFYASNIEGLENADCWEQSQEDILGA
jgi:AGCS family alanine or glycine:cation symporter